MAIVEDGRQYVLTKKLAWEGESHTHTQGRMAIAKDGQQYFLTTKMAWEGESRTNSNTTYIKTQ